MDMGMNTDRKTISRRTFAKQTLGSLLTFSLLETLFQHDAFATEIKPLTTRWLRDVNQLGLDLKDRKMSQVQWQGKIEELYAQVDLPDLLKLIDFEQLTKNVPLVDKGARSLRFNFREIEGVPTQFVFGRQIFALQKDRSVVPHGHNNMATAFLILRGNFHGRHYDRLQDETDHYIIKPTIDAPFGPGGCSTVSDFKDNVHWFKSVDKEPAFIFNIHVMGVDTQNREATGRLYMNPEGEKLAGGLIRAPKLDHEQAHKLYG